MWAGEQHISVFYGTSTYVEPRSWSRVGTRCCTGPTSRESDYFEIRDDAEDACVSGSVPRGGAPTG